MKTPTIVWLRQDLRLQDNPALFSAAQEGKPLILLYIYDTEYPERWKMGGARKWWLHHSLSALEADLKAKGMRLLLRKGDPLEILKELAKKTKAQAVFWNRCYEPFALKRDRLVEKELKSADITFKNFNGSLLAEPWEITNQSGGSYKVFSQFWKNVLKAIDPTPPLPVPKMQPYEDAMHGDSLDDWKLLPSAPDWSEGISAFWKPGERGANEALADFVKDALFIYKEERDFPAKDSTSFLSPHLHQGELSPRQAWHAVAGKGGTGSQKASVDCFLSEIGWREFSYHLLYHFPDLPQTPFVDKFKRFPWDENARKLKAWQKGITGYPIVDAGMRQLWEIGWMHNRVRMIAASFLTKDLFIHWRKGEEWFWDTLVDADLANNSASWQWVAGSGADAAPYFRIFNPVLQGEKFDSEGEYIREWVPELKLLPAKYIHKPWEAPEEVLKRAGIELGSTYPKPIVDHKEAREEALKRFKALT